MYSFIDYQFSGEDKCLEIRNIDKINYTSSSADSPPIKKK